jgi:hypothetical protein
MAYANSRICISLRPTAAFLRSESQISPAATITAIAHISTVPRLCTTDRPVNVHDLSTLVNNYEGLVGEGEGGGEMDIAGGKRRVATEILGHKGQSLSLMSNAGWSHMEIPVLRHDTVAVVVVESAAPVARRDSVSMDGRLYVWPFVAC